MTKTPRIGFCGIGRMGEPMTRRLLAAGYEVAVWNRSSAKLGSLLDAGAVASATPRALGASVDIALLCLGDGKAVVDVVFGEHGLAHAATPPSSLIDHSTLSPALTRALAQRWTAATGGVWIDAPVSGGTDGAAAGKLAIMTGGPADTIELVTPVLRTYAARVTRMGDVGAGQTTKLANQAIVATTLAGLAEAFVLAKRSGIDTAALPSALQGGWADSVLLQTLWPRMVTPPEHATGTVRVLLKDLDAIAELAEASATIQRVLPEVRRLLQDAAQRGMGDWDLSQVFRIGEAESQAGV
ncbi:NAD binding domain of 6-phosphogluconate dehydrogenase family protein 4 [Achromobacter xylosoxidans A8]|uniref:NAD binding domain of 6-phosphogluconate dehydrogenase family protein 4 n=1 Tax=Achromobacter xylosoxidans (strain A8) TaxID=762376 RepID=E3HNS1_ACHXA|nr:NAD(P)-dependent oxidoreductase [Achromobacter xylosoxidans]ADP17110.1 NAD binding domain of 6-phosphogluconate dehydrogenase family protein 4 [Achromobacter xylosoxidans A8]